MHIAKLYILPTSRIKSTAPFLCPLQPLQVEGTLNASPRSLYPSYHVRIQSCNVPRESGNEAESFPWADSPRNPCRGPSTISAWYRRSGWFFSCFLRLLILLIDVRCGWRVLSSRKAVPVPAREFQEGVPHNQPWPQGKCDSSCRFYKKSSEFLRLTTLLLRFPLSQGHVRVHRHGVGHSLLACVACPKKSSSSKRSFSIGQIKSLSGWNCMI